MTTKEFESYIQREIDSALTIRVNPNADDIAGVYWNDAYTGVSVAPQEVREEFDKSYTDKMGYPYRSTTQTAELIRAKLPRTQDPENYKLLTQKK